MIVGITSVLILSTVLKLELTPGVTTVVKSRITPTITSSDKYEATPVTTDKNQNTWEEKCQILQKMGQPCPSVTPQVYTITQDPSKCQPYPCKTMTISITQENGQSVIDDGQEKAKTKLPATVKKDQLLIDSKQIILPSEVRTIIENNSIIRGKLPTSITKMEIIKSETDQIVYQTEMEKESLLLGKIKIKSAINYQVNASNGTINQENSPWYWRYGRILFKF